MESEDKEMFEDVLEDMNNKEVEGFLIVLEFKNGDRRACYSDIATDLYDYIKEDIEINRKIQSGEWTAEDVEKYIKNKKN